MSDDCEEGYDAILEAEAFDCYTEERTRLGQIPDLRRLTHVNGLFNNPWREPAFTEIQIMPKVNFMIDIAKQRGGRVLELGCGMGYLALEMARNGLEVDAVDISQKAIKIAKKYASENPYTNGFGSLQYRVEDITTMKMGNEQYDSVVTFGTLHHLPNLKRVIPRIHQALKAEGNIILCEPIIENFSWKSALFAAILRAILPTWRPYEEKLAEIMTSEDWKKYVEDIFNEYRRVNEKDEPFQSPFDNVVSSEKALLDPIKKFFSINEIRYEDAFIDRLIGGIRGEKREMLGQFLKFLDGELIREGVLEPTYILVHGIK